MRLRHKETDTEYEGQFTVPSGEPSSGGLDGESNGRLNVAKDDLLNRVGGYIHIVEDGRNIHAENELWKQYYVVETSKIGLQNLKKTGLGIDKAADFRIT